ncbi:tRNA CCA-pyrophosphorylase [Pollutimonas subterranea]|uniref:tRNA CCA-pyrophosphorylase n=1 Tax=Pollutimonas subterranea TaxID=2045210 RepID=A0A2N4U2T0_9BURK|nr:tRNA CCA-pyrophosphorylase [Pollutimonas subterranea]PLC49330.1 tRNA CCA-pyrophosphorylase [Pollutimonas subterranea]
MSHPAIQGLDVYIVGGAVRDELLGLPAGDRDWVVVGATPEEMARRGFIPVGGDFPVFLHPETKEEYALARTERKSGRGYKGFTFYTGTDVTLEDDLQRRDLTVNAIAKAPDGRLIDPLDGQSDVRQKVLRHVGQAFTEDPVRLLRLARFAARFHDFSVAPETMELARKLVDDGEVDELVPERVWREVAKGLLAEQPGRMFDVLERSGALPRVLPGLRFNALTADELARAAQAGLGLPARLAILCRFSDAPECVAQHVRAPRDSQDYARLLPVVLDGLAAPGDDSPGDDSPGDDSPGDDSLAGAQTGGAPTTAELCLDLMERCDALRKPDRFLDLLGAAAICRQGIDQASWVARVDAIRCIDAGAIAGAFPGDPVGIKRALRRARLQALEKLALS